MSTDQSRWILFRCVLCGAVRTRAWGRASATTTRSRWGAGRPWGSAGSSRCRSSTTSSAAAPCDPPAASGCEAGWRPCDPSAAFRPASGCRIECRSSPSRAVFRSCGECWSEPVSPIHHCRVTLSWCNLIDWDGSSIDWDGSSVTRIAIIESRCE